jgi:CRISPR-associated protein Cmr4
VAREKASGLPFLPGSSVKGTLRDNCPDKADQLKVFGPDTANASEYAGSAQFSDQRLLLLPVRSLLGTFAWVTTPYILRRFARDAQDMQSAKLPSNVPVPSADDKCLLANRKSELAIDDGHGLTIYLEDLDLAAEHDEAAATWAEWLAERIFPDDKGWQQMLVTRFCVLHGDTFNFLLSTATEVRARIKLQEDAKTVQRGGLWYEESLPSETVLSGMVVSTPIRATDDEVFSVIEGLTGKTLQFGGKATVGRGLCRTQLVSA